MQHPRSRHRNPHGDNKKDQTHCIIEEPGQNGRRREGCRDQQKRGMSPGNAVLTLAVGVRGNVSTRQLWQHQVEGDPQPAERLHQLLDQEMEAVPACLRMDASSSMISVQSRCH